MVVLSTKSTKLILEVLVIFMIGFLTIQNITIIVVNLSESHQLFSYLLGNMWHILLNLIIILANKMKAYERYNFMKMPSIRQQYGMNNEAASYDVTLIIAALLFIAYSRLFN